MKATEAKFLDFLKKSQQFVIPIYQRTYSWTERECRQLWDDILRCGSNEKIAVHFVGSIVYVESGISQVTHQAPLLVIDGQQRLTTVSLLLAALAEAVGEGEPFEDFSKRKIRNYYLLNPEEMGERHFKLLLSQTDKTSLMAIVENKEQPPEPSILINKNFELFKKWIANGDNDLATICQGLAKLVVVDIGLTRNQDNPQLIFESMNSTGKALSQADLIRNYILMGLEPKLQTRLYEDFWRRMESDFGQEAYGEHFDAFMRHYLTAMTGEIPNIAAVYDAFKDHAQNTRGNFPDAETHIESLVREIRDYARYFCAMELDKETDTDLAIAFQDLRELKVNVAYPFLLELYHDYKAQKLSKADFLAIVRLIETYVFRRAIYAPGRTAGMNKAFAVFAKKINKEKYLESIRAHFLLMPSSLRFPSDNEFHRDFQIRDIYNFRSRNYWLRRLENFERKELVSVSDYTIEHILPQNENLSPEWQTALGEDWGSIQDTYLHTLGNLTLTAYNSEYSDKPFPQKRDLSDKGFRHSPLKLNQGLGALESWNEDTIKDRANRLATIGLKVWATPKLSQEILEGYKPKSDDTAEYTIEDHPFLLTSSMQPLFEAFRKAVLALDSCVYEDFNKRHIAYKAEGVFVAINPRQNYLYLTLNLPFSKIIDPKGLCRDIADISPWRWKKGVVEVKLSNLAEMPYIMTLVRQSLDRQLTNNDER